MAASGPPHVQMACDADEYEHALALEITYQRRQWSKIQKMEKQIEEQVVRMQGLERQLQEQMDRHRAIEKQVELHRRVAQITKAGLVERCNEERKTRENEFHGLQASIQALEDKFDGTLREAVRDLTHSHQKGQQELRSSCDAVQLLHEDLARELGGRCKDLERLFAECTELARGCSGHCADLSRKAAEEHDARRKEVHGLQASVKALEGKFDDMLLETVRDLLHSHQEGHQELRSSCIAAQRQHEDLVHDLGSRCKDMEQHWMEELRSSIVGLECWSNEMVRESTKGLRSGLLEVERKCDDLFRSLGEKHASASRSAEAEKRMSNALKEIAARVDSVEQNLESHTHQFTATKIYKSGLMTPSASSPNLLRRK